MVISSRKTNAKGNSLIEENRNRTLLIDENVINPIIEGDVLSKHVNFYKAVKKAGVSGYLDIVRNSIVGVRKGTPQNVLYKIQNIKSEYPEMFKKGMWGM